MAQLHKNSLQLAATGSASVSDCFKAQGEEMTRLQAASDALPPGTLKGLIYQTPYADGHAMYIVKTETPLVLQHIDYLDGYQVPTHRIRGLRREDLLQYAEQRRRLVALFAKQDAEMAQRQQAKPSER